MGALCSTGGKQEPKQEEKERDPDFPFVPPDNIVQDVWALMKKEKVLGKGASCEVDYVIRKADGAEFAMKVMKKDDKWNPILFKQEVDLLTSLEHPNILAYRDCYMDRKNFYVCTELCKGGELFDKIKELKNFSEKVASSYLRTIISAIDHCHRRNIVHRDLKPENIVFRTKQQKNLVIIDFGDAKVIDDEETYEDFVGTAFYLAPECVRDRKGWELKKSDMWTIGVIAYVLLTGRPPFFGRGNKEILRKILKGKVSFPSSTPISDSAKKFILSLIQTDPKKRFSSDKALKHKWLKGETASDKALGDEVLSNIANYTRASKLKKLLVRMLARDMDNEDEKELHSQFALMDDDGDGYIDLKELTKFIKNTGVSHAEAYRRASSIMDDIDQDGDGKISVDEFKDSRISTQLQNDEVIRKQFNQIDVDGDGHITQEELAELFNWTLADQMIIEMIKEIDENGDGVISLEEFEAAMKKGAMAQALQPKQQSKEESMKQLSSKIKKMQNMNI